jgi:hypothetical protein
MTSGVGAVWAVNTQTDAWEKTIVPTESNALLGHFDFSPGGDKAFVADSKNCGVAMIDVAAASAVGFTPMSSCDPDYGMSSGVSSVAVSPGGSTVYRPGYDSKAVPGEPTFIRKTWAVGGQFNPPRLRYPEMPPRGNVSNGWAG